MHDRVGMTNTNLIAAVALTFGVFACERSSDKASETHTTSATPSPAPAETAPPAPAAPALTDEPQGETTSFAPQVQRSDAGTDAGSRGRATGAPAGMTTGTQTGTTGNPNSGTTDDAVAPGHIMFPPEKGPGTGRPNSNGSHNLGSGAPRR